VSYSGTVSTPVSVRIDKLVAGGDGLARMDDGRVIFVPGVLAGEVVDVALSEEKRDFGRGRLVSVVEASANRRVPPCPRVAEGCGGCDWQHIERRIQGQAKLAIVIEAYARTAKMDVAPQLRRLTEDARRTTVRMVADTDGVLGFRAHESHDIVPVSECMVAHPLINDFISRPVLAGEGEVTIRVGARTAETGVWCHDGKLSTDLAAGTKIGERATVTERVGDHEYKVSMGSFFQSSPEAAELIIDSVSRRLDTLGIEGGYMVDAYGGVGLFSLAFSQRFDELMLVESSESACRDAVRNLADCAATIEQSNMDQWESVEADVVIADPSRHGLGKMGAAAVIDTGAHTVILVSCDPVAGARDARYLCDAGYTLGEVEVLDIFPETHHVEVVAAFSR
jgi:23S rRNA (uracil1939-C5)-methyltransferase